VSTPPVQAEYLTVDAVFTSPGTSYVVPIYQRNYAWGLEQIEQLVDDVRTAWDADADHYFLGNLVVAQRPSDDPAEGARTLEVIDGQQRLTTLWLLLTALPTDPPPEGRLRYASRPKADKALSDLTGSHEGDVTGLRTAYKVVRQALASRVGNAEEQKHFAGFLRHRVRLVRATLVGETDLNRYFEIMNTRGQQLEQVDIVKARLMRHLAGDPAAQGCFAWLWDACRDMDAYVQMTLTRTIAIGRRTQLRSQVFGDSWDSLQVSGFDKLQALHAEHQTADAAPAAGPAGNGRSLAESLAAYAEAPSAEDPEDPESVRFRSPITFASFLLHVLKVLDATSTDADDTDEGRLDDNKLIRLFDDRFGTLAAEHARAETERFAAELLRCRFVLDNYVLKREHTATNGDDGDWSLKRLTVSRTSSSSPAYPASFAAGTEDDADDAGTGQVLLLQSMLRVTYTSPRTMHWITAVLRLPGLEVHGRTSVRLVQDELQHFARRRVRRAFFAGEEPTGFAIERIVFTYLDYLLVRDALTAYRFGFRNSVEHFFPQSPDQDQVGADPVPRLLQSFGNLALISVGANSKFSNSLPRFKTGFAVLTEQSPKLALMAQQTKDSGTWNDAAIEQHRAQMVGRLRRDLGLPPV